MRIEFLSSSLAALLLGPLLVSDTRLENGPIQQLPELRGFEKKDVLNKYRRA
jgi:hypothetical protein